MLFSVEADHGTAIRAYVIPDSAGTPSTVLIRAGGADLVTLTANETRPDIVAAGRHATGQCGFVIDESVVPGLASYFDLEIVEAKTGLRVYRRQLTTHLVSKVFRLETQLVPLRALDEVFKDRLQYWFPSVERYGSETADQVFHLLHLRSTYISGRILLSQVQLDLSKGYRSIAMLRDPFNELAERLIVLKTIGTRAEELLGPRDALTFEPVLEALADIEAFDRQSCKRFFKRTDRSVLAILASPLVRQLTNNNFEEKPSKGRLGIALDMLAQFEVLGLRSDPTTFAHAVAETFDVDPTTVPVLHEPASILELGGILRESRDAEALLESDLEVFEHLANAFSLHAPG